MFVLAWVTAWRVRLPGRITALEVRRLISEAQEHGAPFVLRYTRLPSEAHSLPGSFVTYRYNNGPAKASRCRARQPGALFARPCAANELPRLPPPGPLASKFLLYTAHPVLDDKSEDPYCLG